MSKGESISGTTVLFVTVNGHYSTALKNYFEALVAASDYFLRPVPKTVVEDFIYRRMVKCCMMLQCYTQVRMIFRISKAYDQKVIEKKTTLMFFGLL